MSELGRRLQLIHAAQWLSATQGDPYARLLLGHDADPYPGYAEVRAAGALVASRDGVWVTARHRTGADLLAHPSLGVRRADGERSLEPIAPLEDTPLGAEREDLERLGKAAAAGSVPLLGAGAAERYTALADQACRRVLAGVGAEADLVPALAEALPAEVLADLCELTGPDRARLAEDCRWAGLAQDALLCPQSLASTRRMLAALDDLRDLYGVPRPVHGDAGLLLALLGVRVAADLIAGAVRALLDHPWQWSKLAADPWLAARAVNETLRHDPPVHLRSLVAHHDLEVDGVQITAGSRVVVLIGGTGRDAEAFTDPDTFELDRPAGQGPALSPGFAHELVAPFARAVAEAALRALAGRFPRLSAAGPALGRRRAPVTRGSWSLPVVTGGTNGKGRR
ncbi:P450-derived glycosyltransferase activator [Spirillospora sp. NPDC047279]|uniref:cytochrome P450 family protein n=1 Tax=Spirillospora sp. NPDC047279 TaxID=3155478 RepID=UPI0033EA762E